MLAPCKKSNDKPRQYIKNKRHYLANKGPSIQSYDFSSSHVWMWELDHKKGWTLKNRCFRIVMQKTLGTPLRSKQSFLKEINPKYSLQGVMMKLKLQYFGHLMRRVNSLEKSLMLGKTEGRRRKGTVEDGIVGWHHQLNSHEFDHTPGDSERQGSLAFCSP